MSQAWEGYGVRVVREPQPPYPKPRIDGPAGAVEILRRQLPLEDREVFVAVLVDTRNQVLGIHTVSIGSLCFLNRPPARGIQGRDLDERRQHHPRSQPPKR